MIHHCFARLLRQSPYRLGATLALVALVSAPAHAAPKVVLISLDGGTPRLVRDFLRDGTIPADKGLGLLARVGAVAERNTTVNPSLTAAAHIGMTTGSSAARNDVVSNTFHLVASPFAATISGFSAPIGGYSIHGPSEASDPTAEPLWLAARAAGKRVVTATFPGGDGLDVRVPGLAGSPIIQSAAKRTVDYTVPFGAFGGVGASGFVLSAANFGPAPATTLAQLAAAGRASFSPVLQTTAPIESFTVAGASFRFLVAALDTTNDGTVNYDTLVFFDQTRGIQPGPFAPPATGAAFVKASDQRSSLFFLEGTTTKAGLAFFVSRLAPNLATVHIGRYSASFIPRNPPVLADVDDVNAQVGFWGTQADFRIPERLSPGFDTFDDLELEAMYEDMVVSFVDYQTRLALHAIERNPNADVVMIYIEQPDGSEHQFLLVDPRQASNPRDPNSIGRNQDPAKVARYQRYLRTAYRAANDAVQRVIDAVGTSRDGRPASNVLVASDHGFAPFHTAVNMGAFLVSRGFDPAKVRAITSGPAAHIYISLQGREPNGTVGRAEFLDLQTRIVAALRDFTDLNPNYAPGRKGVQVFDQVVARPASALTDPDFGLRTSNVIGQDSGDVYATMSLGYNFDGTQSPVVTRLGDDPVTARVLSVPNFYGAHGYDPNLPDMSAILFAAGPDVCRKELGEVRNIDLAPTVLRLLGVRPAATVQGRALRLCEEGEDRGRDED